MMDQRHKTIKKCNDHLALNSRSRVTRRDIAALAGVSLATVTYALNPKPDSRISKQTCERVQAIASEMGYRPHFGHRSISAGKTFVIGLILPQSKAMMFPFYELMIEGLLGSMNADDYDPLFLVSSHWERVDKVVRQGRVDGLMMIKSQPHDHDIRRAAAMGVPLVVMNRDLPTALENDAVACVFSDHAQFMREAVGELVSYGCRRLLNFSDVQATFSDHANALAFESELARFADAGVEGFSLSPVWGTIAPGVDHIFDPYHSWDGILVNGGHIAGEIVRVAESRGLRPGRDFELITRDAYPETHGYGRREPMRRFGRSVYFQQPFQVGEQAWRLMQTLLHLKQPQSRSVQIPYARHALSQTGPMLSADAVHRHFLKDNEKSVFEFARHEELEKTIDKKEEVSR